METKEFLEMMKNSKMGRPLTIMMTMALFIFMLAGCTHSKDASMENKPNISESNSVDEIQPETLQTEESAEVLIEENEETAESEEQSEMRMKIGDTTVLVEWEDNEAVEALMEMTEKEPLSIQMSMYGGFEQVGSIGMDLPRDDKQTTTESGDIVLYSGNQMVVFYGSNSWAYTRLGHISDKSSLEMAELLGNGDVTITIER